MAKSTIIQTDSAVNKSTIKFDMHNDEDTRAHARTAYEVAKIFKEAGIRFRKVIPAHSDLSTRKLFKLGSKGTHLCLEVSLQGKNEIQAAEYIEEIKDQFLLLPHFILVNNKNYNLDRSTLVHRFLFKPSMINR